MKLTFCSDGFVKIDISLRRLRDRSWKRLPRSKWLGHIQSYNFAPWSMEMCHLLGHSWLMQWSQLTVW